MMWDDITIPVTMPASSISLEDWVPGSTPGQPCNFPVWAFALMDDPSIWLKVGHCVYVLSTCRVLYS